MSHGAPHIVLHVGAHAPSSWLIRKCLLENTGALRRSGTAVVPSGVLADTIGWGGKLLADTQPLTDALTALSADSDVLVASHENTLGQPFDEGGGLYTDAAPTLQALARATDGWDVTILLLVSPFDAFIEGRYLRAVSHGDSRTFADWLAAKDLSTLSFRPLHEQVVDVFGHQRVRVLDERLLDGGRAAFIGEFFRLAEVPMPFEVAEPVQKAGGLSGRGLEITLAANPHLARDRDRDRLHAFVASHFSALDYPPEQLLSAEQAATLRDSFAEDYSALSADIARATTGGAS